MKTKYLLPLNQKKLWIPISLFLISVLLTLEVFFLSRLYPEYSLRYILFYSKRILWLFIPYFLTLFSFAGYLLTKKSAERIRQKGTYYSGRIVGIIWVRSHVLDGREWSVQFRVEYGKKNFVTKDYGFEILNYLSGENCSIYQYKRKNIITDFQLSDRTMTKAERKQGRWGAEPPFFPICDRIKLTYHKKRNKVGYRYMPIKPIAGGLLLFFFLLMMQTQCLGTFQSSMGDSDQDGAPDYWEFSQKTDPLEKDESFTYEKTMSLDGVVFTLKVKAPYVPSDQVSFFVNKTGFRASTDTPGRLCDSFDLDFTKEATAATLIITVPKEIHAAPGVTPRLCLFDFSAQEEGMKEIPAVYEENQIKINLMEVRHDSECVFFFLNKSEFDAVMSR